MSTRYEGLVEEVIKMSYDDLLKEFNKKVKELRASCKHRESGWVKEVYPGNVVMKARICKRCKKTLERK